MKDIETLDDIKTMVDHFYTSVREDDTVGPIFTFFIKDWAPHLEKMYKFWQTLLLEEHTYSGSPFPPHVKLPIRAEHFERWVEIFHRTVDDKFHGERAQIAKQRSEQIAQVFKTKLELIKTDT
ncbi:MAG: group III truncated hemoglobin [Flavobacteriales bacterium]|nr:group III truncated hemoglobin [Flavobacteriales bacterium]